VRDRGRELCVHESKGEGEGGRTGARSRRRRRSSGSRRGGRAARIPLVLNKLHQHSHPGLDQGATGVVSSDWVGCSDPVILNIWLCPERTQVPRELRSPIVLWRDLHHNVDPREPRQPPPPHPHRRAPPPFSGSASAASKSSARRSARESDT
jgi:hypothetical protein